MFRLKIILLEASLIDLAFGIFVLAFASQIQNWLDIGRGGEPFLIRIVGGFLVFIGYLYYLAYLHHERHIIMVQATLMLRFIFILLLFGEIFIMIKGPFSIVHISLLIPAIGEVYFAAAQAYHLKRMGMPFIPIFGG